MNTLENNPIYTLPFSKEHEAETREINRQANVYLDKVEEDKPSTGKQIAAAFGRDNYLSAVINSEPKPHILPQKGYRVEDDIEGYQDQWDSFVGSSHPDTTAWIKRSIDKHRKYTETLEKGDWTGVLGSFVATATSPVNMALILAGPLGVGVGAGAGSMAVSAGRNVAAGLVATAADEALLHTVYPDMRAEDSMMVMGATAILDGILGGAVGRMTRGSYDGLVNQTAKMMRDGPVSAGAAFHGPMVKGAAMKKAQPLWRATGIDWVARKMSRITPNGRLSQSPEPAVIGAWQQVSEVHPRFEGDALPTASETLVKLDQRKAFIDIINVRKDIKASGLTNDEFSEQWAHAMRMGVGENTNEFVAKAVKTSRDNIYDNFWQRATEAGLEGTYYEKKVKFLTDEEKLLKRQDGSAWVEEGLDEGMTVRLPINQNTAPEYLQRWYDVNKVRDNPSDFYRAVREGLEDSMERRNLAIDDEIASLQADITARGDLGDKVVIDYYEGIQGAQETILAEAKAQYPGAVRNVNDLQKLELTESIDDIELPALAKVAEHKVDVNKEIADLEQLVKDIRSSSEKQIKASMKSKQGTAKSRLADRKLIRETKKNKLVEIKAQRGVHQQRLVDLTTESKKIKSEGVEARDFIRTRKKQLLQKVDSRLSELKRARPDVSLKDYGQARKRYTKLEAEYEARLNELEADRPAIPDENEWAEITRGYYSNVTNVKPGDIHAYISNKGNSYTKSRVDIKDEFLLDFLEKDPEVMMGGFVNAISPRIRLAQINGGRDGDYMLEGLLGEIDEAYKPQIEALSGSARKKLENRALAETKDLRAIRDQMLGMMQPSSISQTNPILASSIRTIRNWNVPSKLGAVNIASIPDLSRIMTYDGLGNFTKAASKAFKHIGLENLPEDELMALASSASRANNVRWADMMSIDDTIPVTRAEAVSKWAAHKTLKWTGMQTMDSIDKTLSGSLVANKVTRDVLNGTDVGNLKHLGMSADNIEVMEVMIRQFGLLEDGYHTPRIDLWRATDDISQVRINDAVETFEAAVIKEADRMIMTPGIGDKPVLMSTEAGQTIGQFKSFIIGAVNRISIPLMQEQGIRPIVEMMTAVSLGVLAMTAKHVATGREIDWDAELVAKDALDRSGIVAYTFEMYNMFQKVFGYDPISAARAAITGDEYKNKETSKYRSRDVWGSILGPTAGTISDIIKASGGSAKVDSRVHAMRRIAFLQNHWALNRLNTDIEGRISKALGGTGKYAERKNINKPVTVGTTGF